jgi:hypothetical protein
LAFFSSIFLVSPYLGWTMALDSLILAWNNRILTQQGRHFFGIGQDRHHHFTTSSFDGRLGFRFLRHGATKKDTLFPLFSPLGFRAGLGRRQLQQHQQIFLFCSRFGKQSDRDGRRVLRGAGGQDSEESGFFSIHVYLFIF